MKRARVVRDRGQSRNAHAGHIGETGEALLCSPLPEIPAFDPNAIEMQIADIHVTRALTLGLAIGILGHAAMVKLVATSLWEREIGVAFTDAGERRRQIRDAVDHQMHDFAPALKRWSHEFGPGAKL